MQRDTALKVNSKKYSQKSRIRLEKVNGKTKKPEETNWKKRIKW